LHLLLMSHDRNTKRSHRPFFAWLVRLECLLGTLREAPLWHLR